MRIGRVSFSVFFLIVAIDILDTAANLLMKKGMGHLSAFYLGAGLLIYAVNFILWMKILTKADLSIALPLASASYILVPLISVIFLHEEVGLLRWTAIALIILGIFFLSHSETNEDGEHRG